MNSTIELPLKELELNNQFIKATIGTRFSKRTTNIMLDQISSCQYVHESKPLIILFHFFYGVGLALLLLFLSATPLLNKSGIGQAIFLVVVFSVIIGIVRFFRSKKTIIAIKSPSASIEINAKKLSINNIDTTFKLIQDAISMHKKNQTL